MEWSKIKNIVLVILVGTNLCLLFFLVRQEVEHDTMQEETRAHAISFLQKNGIDMADSVVPKNIALGPQLAARDTGEEAEIAAAVLGEGLVIEARTDGAYRYVAGTDFLQFASDGSVWGEFPSGAISLGQLDVDSHAQEMLGRLKLAGDVVSQNATADGHCTVTAEQRWGDTPIFNRNVILEYSAEALVAITVECRTFSGGTAGDGTVISVATALMNFYTGATGLGDVFSRIENIEQGYIISVRLSGQMEFVPGWHITTDTGGYQLNLLSGELTRFSGSQS